LETVFQKTRILKIQLAKLIYYQNRPTGGCQGQTS